VQKLLILGILQLCEAHEFSSHRCNYCTPTIVTLPFWDGSSLSLNDHSTSRRTSYYRSFALSIRCSYLGWSNRHLLWVTDLYSLVLKCWDIGPQARNQTVTALARFDRLYIHKRIHRSSYVSCRKSTTTNILWTMVNWKGTDSECRCKETSSLPLCEVQALRGYPDTVHKETTHD
jgi:hypothetical protein